MKNVKNRLFIYLNFEARKLCSSGQSVYNCLNRNLLRALRSTTATRCHAVDDLMMMIHFWIFACSFCDKSCTTRAVARGARRRSTTTTRTFQCASYGTFGSARRFIIGRRSRRSIGWSISYTCRSTSPTSSSTISTAPNYPGKSIHPFHAHLYCYGILLPTRESRRIPSSSTHWSLEKEFQCGGMWRDFDKRNLKNTPKNPQESK